MVCVVYDSCSTTECVSGDYSSEIRQENLANVKQERDDVCCVRLVYCNRNTQHRSFVADHVFGSISVTLTVVVTINILIFMYKAFVCLTLLNLFLLLV